MRSDLVACDRSELTIFLPDLKLWFFFFFNSIFVQELNNFQNFMWILL